MLAANAQFEPFACGPPAFGCQLDQLADPVDIEADERIARENTPVDIGREEAAGIVAADAQRRQLQRRSQRVREGGAVGAGAGTAGGNEGVWADARRHLVQRGHQCV